MVAHGWFLGVAKMRLQLAPFLQPGSVSIALRWGTLAKLVNVSKVTTRDGRFITIDQWLLTDLQLGFSTFG